MVLPERQKMAQSTKIVIGHRGTTEPDPDPKTISFNSSWINSWIPTTFDFPKSGEMGIANVRYSRKTNNTEPIRWVQIFIVSLWLRKRLWKNETKLPTLLTRYKMKDKPYSLSSHSHYHASMKDLRKDHLWTNQAKACDCSPYGNPASKQWKIPLNGCQSFLTSSIVFSSTRFSFQQTAQWIGHGLLNRSTNTW